MFAADKKSDEVKWAKPSPDYLHQVEGVDADSQSDDVLIHHLNPTNSWHVAVMDEESVFLPPSSYRQKKINVAPSFMQLDSEVSQISCLT